MIDPLRLLGANIRVAINLQHANTLQERAGADDAAWNALIARAEAIGCRLQRCYLDPDSDGSCDCGAGLWDRNGDAAGHWASDLESQSLDVFTTLVEDIEANGGLRK